MQVEIMKRTGAYTYSWGCLRGELNETFVPHLSKIKKWPFWSKKLCFPTSYK